MQNRDIGKCKIMGISLRLKPVFCPVASNIFVMKNFLTETMTLLAARIPNGFNLALVVKLGIWS